MDTVSSLAFKEWAVIIQALARGSQMVVLRKGGIQEGAGGFNTKHESFLLYPTYEHQKVEDLNSLGQRWLGDLQQETPLTNEKEVTFQYFAQVRKRYWIHEWDKLAALSDFHVWSESALRKRFEWSAEKGVHAFAIRVFKLQTCRTVQNLSVYGGCRSWVKLRNPVLLETMTPVLKADIFREKFKVLHQILTQ